MSIIKEIAQKALDKFPETPSKTLAAKIYDENPQVFTNLDSARSVIRYYRGQRGNKKRKYATHPRESFSVNPFDDLPEELTDFADWKPYELKPDKWLVIADTHIPYYKRNELILALQTGKEENVSGIILLGDICDFYSISWWIKDPRRRNFKKDRNALLKALEVIRRVFPKMPVIYKLGNHEERLERYLRVKAPELLDLELLNFESIIEADKYDIQVVGEKRLIKIDKLFLLHGHEFGTSFFNPVNPARGLFLRGKEIALCAHYHQTSQHTEKSLDDTIISCWSVGCLSDLHPEWKPLNKWNHGFAIVDNRGKKFRVYNKKIIKGEIF